MANLKSNQSAAKTEMLFIEYNVKLLLIVYKSIVIQMKIMIKIYNYKEYKPDLTISLL